MMEIEKVVEVTQMGRKKESLVAQNSRRGLKGRLRGRCCAEAEQINTEAVKKTRREICRRGER